MLTVVSIETIGEIETPTFMFAVFFLNFYQWEASMTVDVFTLQSVVKTGYEILIFLTFTFNQAAYELSSGSSLMSLSC